MHAAVVDPGFQISWERRRKEKKTQFHN